ncbi:TPA: hypothetical protein ACH3X2_009016 [Trebouxia sp. C0005]
MLGDRTFAAVGAAPGLSSAIAAAALLAKESQQPLSLGRVRPMFLAGVEAYVWAHSKGLSTAPSIESTAKWHVIPRALEQWQKYKIMIYEDGAKKQQPAQHPSQSSSHDRSATPAAPLAPDAQQTCATHPPVTQQTVAANPARQSSLNPPKAEKQRLSPDMQQDRQAQQQQQQQQRHAQQQQQQQQQAVQCGLAQSGIGVHQQPWNLTEEHAGHLNDTVGAVYIDAAGRVGAGVSSGGIAMKVPGRVGEAAMYACGCWAADADVSLGRPGVACSVSGVGEVIIRACLAKECCQRMLNLDLPVDEACSQVMQESTMQEAQPNNCGVLAVRVTFDSASPGQVSTECSAVHCSRSMGLAWSALHGTAAPHCQILRQSDTHAIGQQAQLVATGCFHQWLHSTK